MKQIIFMLLCLSLSCELHSQQAHYIRDTLYVPLRSGQSPKHRIVHKGLASGTPVTIVENNADTGYSLVRTRKGLEGWIPTQYLSTEPAGRDLYQKAQQSLNSLKQQNLRLNQQLNELQDKDRQSRKQISELTSTSNTLGKELDDIKQISSNALTLNSDNKKLLEENQQLKNQVDILSASNRRLEDNRENDAFLNGAFAVLIGVMITLIVPRLWPRKSSEWA